MSKIGISKGTLDIALDQPLFVLGATVSGAVSYRLKKPAEGRVLWVEVRATQTITQPKPVRVRRDESWTTEIRRSTQTNTLFQRRQELDDYHLYDQGSYRFEIALPQALPKTTPDSDIVKAAEMVQSMFSGIPVMRSPVTWSVEAKLEIPWSLAVSDKQRFEVSESPLPPSSRFSPPTSASNFCGECGEKREQGHKFCPNCGEKF